jgi:hypothetical protein
VLKNCRPDVHPPWSGRAKPYMEITCSGRATVRTSVSHRPDPSLKQERFQRNFQKILSHSCPSGWLRFTVRTTSVHITTVAHSAPHPINRGPWALRTARINRPDAYLRKARIAIQNEPSGHLTAVVRTREACYGNYLQRTCVRPDDRAISSGRCSYTGKISRRKFRKILSHSCPS